MADVLSVDRSEATVQPQRIDSCRITRAVLAVLAGMLGIVTASVGFCACLVEARAQTILDMSLVPGDQSDVGVDLLPFGLWLLAGAVLFAMSAITEQVTAERGPVRSHGT
jgi:hypothetical protein